jgi:hypothetical protein
MGTPRGHARNRVATLGGGFYVRLGIDLDLDHLKGNVLDGFGG